MLQYVLIYFIRNKDKITSASVELTQTRHSHSNSFSTPGAQMTKMSRGFYREGQKATYAYATCKPLFLAVAEI